jgi:hypothetical protein
VAELPGELLRAFAVGDCEARGGVTEAVEARSGISRDRWASVQRLDERWEGRASISVNGARCAFLSACRTFHCANGRPERVAKTNTAGAGTPQAS